MTAKPPTFAMFATSNDDSKPGYTEHKLERATSRDEAHKIAMGMVRVLDIKDMYLVQDDHLVFIVYPNK